MIVIAAVILFFVSISTLTRFYTDLLWFREIGFNSVFWTILSSQALLASIFGIAFFVLMMVNVLIVGRTMPLYRIANDPEDALERYRGAFLPYLRLIAIGGSAVLAIFFALGITPLWENFILAQNAVAFDQVDPVFGKDLSYYVFKLPVYSYIYGWLQTSLILITLVVAGAHYLTGGIRPQSVGDRVSPAVKAHLSVLIGLIALLKSWGYRLDQFNLLYSERGGVTGASYTDTHAELPALRLLVIISIIAAVLFLVNIRIRGWALPIAGLGLWLLTSLLVAGVFPLVVQKFRVDPAELQREGPFIKRNIESTRAAYGLDAMDVREFPAKTEVTPTEIEGNQRTIDNIRLWDPETLKTAYRQLQEIRPYYRFMDVDVDRYQVGDETRQLMVSTRELDVENLESRTWQNERIVYTHGYGAVASPTHEKDVQGQPSLLMQDIPPVTDIESLKMDQPAVYFGEGFQFGAGYSIVGTDQPELDFATEDRTETTEYEGKGGVAVQHLLRRLAFAWRFRDINLAISGLINNESKVIYHREVRERVRKAAPFIQFDGDPYAVIDNGRVVWMIDGYTTSPMYPYSSRLDFSERSMLRGGDETGPSLQGRNNYIRNSVKATIDSYDGTVKLYIWDEEDPIIRAWQKVFPEIFTAKSEMPPSLLAHVRYPEDLFRIQTSLYLRYHMVDVTEFYTREDLWVIPEDPDERPAGRTASLSRELQPYYVLMKLPGEDEESYVLILPTNPRNRPNMVSLLVAKSDPDEYGELIDFRFPTGRQIPGVGQIDAAINQDPDISRTKTLLDQAGSNVILGNLLVLPLGDSILYSQPFFVQAATNPIPELAFVILATRDRVVMQPTLEEALEALVSGQERTTPLPGGGLPSLEESDRIAQALEHLQRADEALRRGDLTAYQRENEAARRVLEGSQQDQPAASPSPAG